MTSGFAVPALRLDHDQFSRTVRRRYVNPPGLSDALFAVIADSQALFPIDRYWPEALIEGHVRAQR
jgi:hypothetical protein